MTPDPQPASKLQPAVRAVLLVLVALSSLALTAQPSVTVSTSLNFNALEPGQEGAFSVSLRNEGSTAATNVALTVKLPAGGTFIAATPHFGTADCSLQGNVLLCTKPLLAPDEGLQINAFLTAPSRLDGEDLLIDVTETQTEQDLSPANNQQLVRAVMVRQLVVSNVQDEGTGSLRQAILDTNATCGAKPCSIVFRIPAPVPASGWFTIQPRSPLPTIQAQLKIDGREQTTLTGDTNPDGPEIEINGALVTEESGLRVRPNCKAEIRDLAVNGFPGYGIEVHGVEACATTFTDALIWHNYIGTDPRGITAKPNHRGLGLFTWEGHIYSNLISGNRRAGIFVEDGYYHQIGGNRIGVSSTGTPLGNGAGIFLNMGSAGRDFMGADITQNIIAFNHGMAIARTRRGELLITQNSIYDNQQQGIDAGIDGMSPQNANDVDVPNAPILFGAHYDPARDATIVRGRLDSEAYTTGGSTGGSGRRVEIYASSRLSVWSTPQAETSVAIAPLSSSGHENFEVVVPGDLRGKWITATHLASFNLGQLRGNPRGPATQTHREANPADTSELSNAVMAQ